MSSTISATWCLRISGPRVLAGIAPIQESGENRGPCSAAENTRPPSARQPTRLLARVNGHPRPLPREADAMSLEYKQRAGAGRSGCGEYARQTSVQGQFIPSWSQQAMVYPEVPVNDRATAWLLTETYQSGKHEPAITNDPHNAQREDVRLQQLSDDSCLLRLCLVHAQPEESGAR
jgi:hypothetical protein